MPTRSDAVLAALADGATNRNEIAEATGLEVEAVSQDLSILRGKGLVDKNADGWHVTGGTPGRKEHLQAEPTEAGKPSRKAPQEIQRGGVDCRAQGFARHAPGRGVRQLRGDAPRGRRAFARPATGAAASGIRRMT